MFADKHAREFLKKVEDFLLEETVIVFRIVHFVSNLS